MARLSNLLFAAALPACGAPDARLVVEAESPPKRALFPTYVAQDLDGRTVAVPGDAHSELTLVVVAFQRWQQRDVDGWLSRTQPLFADHPNLDYLELPVIRRMTRPMRWFIDSGMRRGIPDPSKRARVVTLYLDKEEFRSRTNIDREDQVHLFLVRSGSGEILWRQSGPVSDSGIEGLSRALGAESNRTRAASL